MLQVHSIYSPDGGGSSQAGSPRPRSRSGSDSAFAELDSVPLRVDPARLSCGMHRAITALWALESGGTSWIVRNREEAARRLTEQRTKWRDEGCVEDGALSGSPRRTCAMLALAVSQCY